MSLWEVAEENSTHQIIRGFYQHLADGKPRDQAIATAKRDYLQSARSAGGDALRLLHPFYWSELVLIGNDGPLKVERRHGGGPWQFLGIGMPIGLGIATLTWYWRRRQKRKQALVG